MGRAIDAAKAKLDSLSDRNAILDCFFEHGRDLFQFSVLFIVRGAIAQGRNVHGLGAHDELVTRISLPMNEAGILQRARDVRRPFVTSGGGLTDADSRLFGSIGRAMPAGVVVPLVLRDRVVAIFLGDGPAEPLQKRGAELKRHPSELAKDEMLLWAEAVGNALEQLILRKKGSASIRPPGMGPVGLAAPLPAPAGVPAGGTFTPRVPASAGQVVWHLPGDEGYEEDLSDVVPYSTRGATPPRRVGLYLGASAVLLAGMLVGGIYLWSQSRSDSNLYRIVTAGEKLSGWPHVDPMSPLEAARAAAGGKGELASIQAEIGRDGRIDFTERPKNPEEDYLSYVFVAGEVESHVRVDAAGVHAAIPHPRSICGDHPCGAIPATPPCTFAQIREAASKVGLGADDRAYVSYADQREGDPGPGWSLSVVERGSIRLDAATCKPLARQRLLPVSLPLAGLPGAPREVEPMNVLPLARTQSGLDTDAVLLEIEARGLGVSGKIDLTTGDGGITFTFADPPSVPTAVRRWREVLVDKSGMHLTPIKGWLPLPSRFSADIMPPTCSFAGAFKTVGAVPAGATGTVRYGRGSGSAESGELDIVVPSAGLHNVISDAECAAGEKLSHK